MLRPSHGLHLTRSVSRRDEGWTPYSDLMVLHLARWLAPALHTPARPGSALLRSLSRGGGALAHWARLPAAPGRERTLALFAEAQGLATDAALRSFPADAGATEAAMEFMHAALEAAQPGDAAALAGAAAAAMLPGVGAPCRGLTGLAIAAALPAYLRRACRDGDGAPSRAAAGAAAARLAGALLAAAASPAQTHALPALLAPLLDALAPPAEHGGKQPRAPPAVRAAVARLLAALASAASADVAQAAAAASAPLPAAQRQETAPLRCALPLPRDVFDAAAGRVLLAALRSAVGAARDAASAAGAPPSHVKPEDALAPLDAADAALMRGELRWALGLPPPWPHFDAAFPEFQRRKAGLAPPGSAAGAAMHAAAAEEDAACAGVELALALLRAAPQPEVPAAAAEGGEEAAAAPPVAEHAATAMARAAARGFAPAARAAARRGVAPRLVAASRALAAAAGIADEAGDADDDAAAAKEDTPPVPTAPASCSQAASLTLAQLSTMRDAAGTHRVVAVLRPSGRPLPVAESRAGGRHRVLSLSLEDDSGARPLTLLLLDRAADAAAPRVAAIWAAGRPAAVAVTAEFLKRNLCGLGDSPLQELDAHGHPTTKRLLDWAASAPMPAPSPAMAEPAPRAQQQH